MTTHPDIAAIREALGRIHSYRVREGNLGMSHDLVNDIHAALDRLEARMTWLSEFENRYATIDALWAASERLQRIFARGFLSAKKNSTLPESEDSKPVEFDTFSLSEGK